MKVLAFFRRKRFWYLLLVVILTVLLFVYVSARTGFRFSQINAERFTEYMESLGLAGRLLGIVLVVAQTFFPFVPFVLVAGANVAIFGMKWGFVVNYSMSCLGAVLAFYVARYYAHDWVVRKISHFPFVQSFNKRLSTDGFFYIFMGRLIPILPSSAISFGAGLTQISFRYFLWATIIGKLPIIILESMIAHDFIHFQKYKGRFLVLLAVFAVLIYAGNLFKKRLNQKNKIS
ncbi:TVP38/TMEM64 family protein [Paenibacillus larvae]|uniref:TVP38/TMEM64 family protein n=1 Tax=Paenibacillus larvae TaxID=1464 RepID=UPI002853CCE0|nr:TVP38/TMEM64 family protein [Paenibacillus larvae]MDR5584547.1 TVP38/TMEM64 family protein [Paenibacillus larvae]MDR5600638.1 TVP38/TMEM64 family protein [Paenibacillus larvae]